MFRLLHEGDVYSTTQDNVYIVGSRIATLPDGKFICTFHSESKAGINDFVPMAAYSDDGLHWSEPKPVWPELIGKKSIFCSVRATGDGRVCICGACYDIDQQGEIWWSDELAAMKENCLAISISDDGYHFPAPTYVQLPYYAGAENPGGMLVDADGAITIVYAPYPTIEKPEAADTCSLVMMRSTDGGKTFESCKIGTVNPPSEYAETWIARMTDGRLVVSTWQTASKEAPDQYLFSTDNGRTFCGPFASPFRGQSTALTPWTDGRALIVYNQRKEQPAGVWIAVAKPDETGFNMTENIPVWKAASTTRNATGGDFSQWTDFSFGEPHVNVMPDGTLLVCLWYEQAGAKGIRYVHLAHEED